MLLEEIIKFCNNQYIAEDTQHICINCNHKCDCSGSCKNCLKEIHFPGKYPDGKKDYDCKNLINFYVCDYTYKYTSEILYLLDLCEKLSYIDEYHIMSIGCGASPDLMAFEYYLKEINSDKRISYVGFDINTLWKPIHNHIQQYKSSIIEKVQYEYVDAIEFINKTTIAETNVLILQYVISHFYNTNQVCQIDNFIEDLMKHIIDYRDNNNPFIIIINDVNSCHRGRNYFDIIIEKIKANYSARCLKFYFDYNIQNEGQRFGKKHISNNVLFDIPQSIENTYQPWHSCSSAQLLIEIK